MQYIQEWPMSKTTESYETLDYKDLQQATYKNIVVNRDPRAIQDFEDAKLPLELTVVFERANARLGYGMPVLESHCLIEVHYSNSVRQSQQ